MRPSPCAYPPGATTAPGAKFVMSTSLRSTIELTRRSSMSAAWVTRSVGIRPGGPSCRCSQVSPNTISARSPGSECSVEPVSRISASIESNALRSKSASMPRLAQNPFTKGSRWSIVWSARQTMRRATGFGFRAGRPRSSQRFRSFVYHSIVRPGCSRATLSRVCTVEVAPAAVSASSAPSKARGSSPSARGRPAPSESGRAS